MQSGYDEKSLLGYLEEIDKNTSIDSILAKGETLNLTIRRGKQGIKWNAIESQAEGLPLYKGKSYNSFVRRLQKMDSPKNISYPDVYCLYKTEATKKWDGSITCYFYKIDPLQPYIMVSNGLEIPTVEIELTQSEYKVWAETRIGFEEDGVLYPIKSCATPMMNLYLDSNGVMKQTEMVPLSQALIIAERIANREELLLVTRRITDRVKAIVTVRAKGYERSALKTTIRDIIDGVANLGPYRLCKWNIYDDMVIVDLELLMVAFYSARVKIISSDKPGIGTKMYIYARLGKGNVEIYSAKKAPQASVDVLFEGAEDALAKFDDILWQKTDINVTPAMLKGVAKALGKRRSANHPILSQGSKSNEDLYNTIYRIVQDTYEELPLKQAGELSKAYSDICYEIVRKSHE